MRGRAKRNEAGPPHERGWTDFQSYIFYVSAPQCQKEEKSNENKKVQHTREYSYVRIKKHKNVF